MKPNSKDGFFQRTVKSANRDTTVDTAKLLGGVLQEFFEVDIPMADDREVPRRRERVTNVLAKHGLEYRVGGLILGTSVGAPTKSLETILRSRDFSSVEQDFQRAIQSVESDPAASITASCAILEALCKVYIHDEKLELPKEQSLKPLWALVQKHLKLDPASVEDEDVRRILSGMISVVDGIAAFRTHVGSAHGRGRKPYRIEPRHARLAIHASHTLVHFVLETWDHRKSLPPVSVA